MPLRKAGLVALRYKNGRVEVCVVSSRKYEGRWVLPKGTIEKHEKPRQAAVREGFEEAGVLGNTVKPLRIFLNDNSRTVPKARASRVYYPLELQLAADKWPEKKIRRRKWVTLDQLSEKRKYKRVWRVVRQMRRVDRKGWQALLRNLRHARKLSRIEKKHLIETRDRGGKIGFPTDRRAA